MNNAAPPLPGELKRFPTLLAIAHDAGDTSICVPMGSESKRGDDWERTEAVGFSPGARANFNWLEKVTFR